MFSTPQLLSAQRQPSTIPPRSMRLLVLPVMMAHLQLLFLSLRTLENPPRGRGKLSTALPQSMGTGEPDPGQRQTLNCSSSVYGLWRIPPERMTTRFCSSSAYGHWRTRPGAEANPQLLFLSLWACRNPRGRGRPKQNSRRGYAICMNLPSTAWRP